MIHDVVVVCLFIQFFFKGEQSGFDPDILIKIYNNVARDLQFGKKTIFMKKQNAIFCSSSLFEICVLDRILTWILSTFPTFTFPLTQYKPQQYLTSKHRCKLVKQGLALVCQFFIKFFCSHIPAEVNVNTLSQVKLEWRRNVNWKKNAKKK